MGPGIRLTYGASGDFGTAAVQLAKHFGDHRIISGVARADADSIELLGARAEAGELRPVIEL